MHDWKAFLTQPKPLLLKTNVGHLRVQAKIELHWWLMVYLEAMLFFCVLSRRQADPEKLARVVRKGFKVKYNTTPVADGEAHE